MQSLIYNCSSILPSSLARTQSGRCMVRAMVDFASCRIYPWVRIDQNYYYYYYFFFHPFLRSASTSIICCFGTRWLYSTAPESISMTLFTGGIPPILRSPEEVYAETFQICLHKNISFYERYPGDVKRINGNSTYPFGFFSFSGIH